MDLEHQNIAQGEDTNLRNDVSVKRSRSYFRIALYAIMVLSGQTVAILLGRLYFEKGGSSKWIGTLVQLAGFPILIPYFFIPQSKINLPPTIDENNNSSLKMVVFVYAALGLLAAGSCFLYSVGMQYLPVSTVTLISASQLGFNAFFSYFLNSQKFTPFIINSLVLLTVSSVLLVFQSDSSKLAGVSQSDYTTGFLCTVGGVAGVGLNLALQQLAFRKVLKGETFRTVMDLVIYQSLFGTVFATVGFFANGDWERVKTEMQGFGLGKVSYVMTLVSTAVCWQIFGISAVALVFEVSALFCNAIAVLGLPLVSVIAVFVFHDKFDGIKGISLFLAVWGFISYVYQHYDDDRKLKKEVRIRSEGREVCSDNESDDNK